MKVLITGANGQLGFDFKRLLEDKGISFVAAGRSDLDVTDRAAMEKFIVGSGFTHILNCAAYNNVDKAESDIEACYDLNAYAPKNLAELAQKEGKVIKLLQKDDIILNIFYTEKIESKRLRQN